LLAIYKEREPRYRDIKRRMESRPPGRQAESAIADEDEVVEPVAAASRAAVPRPGGPRVATNIPPRPRKKGKRR